MLREGRLQIALVSRTHHARRKGHQHHLVRIPRDRRARWIPATRPRSAWGETGPRRRGTVDVNTDRAARTPADRLEVVEGPLRGRAAVATPPSLPARCTSSSSVTRAPARPGEIREGRRGANRHRARAVRWRGRPRSAHSRHTRPPADRPEAVRTSIGPRRAGRQQRAKVASSTDVNVPPRRGRARRIAQPTHDTALDDRADRRHLPYRGRLVEGRRERLRPDRHRQRRGHLVSHGAWVHQAIAVGQHITRRGVLRPRQSGNRAWAAARRIVRPVQQGRGRSRLCRCPTACSRNIRRRAS